MWEWPPLPPPIWRSATPRRIRGPPRATTTSIRSSIASKSTVTLRWPRWVCPIFLPHLPRIRIHSCKSSPCVISGERERVGECFLLEPFSLSFALHLAWICRYSFLVLLVLFRMVYFCFCCFCCLPLLLPPFLSGAVDVSAYVSVLPMAARIVWFSCSPCCCYAPLWLLLLLLLLRSKIQNTAKKNAGSFGMCAIVVPSLPTPPVSRCLVPLCSRCFPIRLAQWVCERDGGGYIADKSNPLPITKYRYELVIIWKRKNILNINIENKIY